MASKTWKWKSISKREMKMENEKDICVHKSKKEKFGEFYSTQKV